MKEEHRSRVKTMRIGVLHIGQPLSTDATVSAQVAQKRECPHDTRATSERG